MRKQKQFLSITVVLALIISMLSMAAVYANSTGVASGRIVSESVRQDVYGITTNPDGFNVQNGVLKAYTGKETELIIPDDLGITLIGERAFYNCSSLTSVVIPSGVTAIVYRAFEGCSNLVSATIPNSVTFIGEEVFKGSSILEIKGVKDSYSEQYAARNNITFSFIDTVPPVITIGTYVKTPTNKDITVTASTNEGTLNAENHIFTKNGSFDFIATDAAGNVTIKTVKIASIDKTAPKITVKSLSGKMLKQNASIKGGATITITETNINKKVIRKNNTAITWPGKNKVTAKGIYAIIVTDKAGNKATFTFKVT